jgi:hypothetical protein
MKKISLTLIIIFLFLFSIKAQNNWKYIPSNIILESVVSNEYTWILHEGLLVQVSNSTQSVKTFKTPFESSVNYSLQAINEQLIIVNNDQIFHLENGIWTVLLNSPHPLGFSSNVYKSTGQIVVLDKIGHKIYLIKDKNIKTLQLSINYELGDHLSIRNSNSIFFADLSTSLGKLIEIDSNGIEKSYLDKTKIGIGITSIEKLDFNENKLIIYSAESGLIRVNYDQIDTTLQSIYPLNNLNLIEFSSFEFDNNNNILLISEALNTSNIYYLISTTGILLDSAKSPANNGLMLTFSGVTSTNKYIFTYLYNSLYTIDPFGWYEFYQFEHEFSGGSIWSSTDNTFITDLRYYEYVNEKVIKVEYDSIQNMNLRFYYVKKHNNTNYIIGTNNTSMNLYSKLENEHIKLISQIPDFLTYPIKNLIIDSLNQVYILSSDQLIVYKANNTWDTIASKTSNNITNYNSMCIDNSGTIWIATNAGIARIINNEISLEDRLNIRLKTKNIIFSSPNNSLIFNSINSTEEKLYVYDLRTNQTQSFNTINQIDKMIVNKKGELYTLYKNDGLCKFNLNSMNWDTNFNNSKIGTPFESNVYDFNIDQENRIYLFRRLMNASSHIYIYNEDSTIKNIDNNDVNLYPNPFSDVINIATNEIFYSFSIINNEGKEIQSGLITNNKIHTHRLPMGTYFIKFYGTKGTITKKIIKN